MAAGALGKCFQTAAGDSALRFLSIIYSFKVNISFMFVIAPLARWAGLFRVCRGARRRRRRWLPHELGWRTMCRSGRGVPLLSSVLPKRRSASPAVRARVDLRPRGGAMNLALRPMRGEASRLRRRGVLRLVVGERRCRAMRRACRPYGAITVPSSMYFCNRAAGIASLSASARAVAEIETVIQLSPGRKPSFSPASGVGRVRMMRRRAAFSFKT